jgi:hypothetical protein
MGVMSKLKRVFKVEEVDFPEHDSAGEVLSQLYDDILDHRKALASEGNEDYKEFAAQALHNLNMMAPDEASKRAALVILAEALKR